ncbi:MAG: 50S ribosomal protein L9 [Anaerolineae bacterium]|nr:50S ribosomal protein L9 [Thermoflexales bacterium]MDW8407640.1 50S ribosomal protein L9 [Anaerolineae bacterium]
MKVLLTQDVYNLGRAGEVKTVADGYGRNYLLPRGLAVLATPGAVKRADAIKAAALRRRAQEQSDLEATAQILNGATLTFAARTGEKGKLYGSITTAQIADKISALLGKEFDRRKIALREPIRTVGSYAVTVRLAADVAPVVNVVVVQEGAAGGAESTSPSAEAKAEPQAEGAVESAS